MRLKIRKIRDAESNEKIDEIDGKIMYFFYLRDIKNMYYVIAI